jgi:hypothetical protein
MATYRSTVDDLKLDDVSIDTDGDGVYAPVLLDTGEYVPTASIDFQALNKSVQSGAISRAITAGWLTVAGDADVDVEYTSDRYSTKDPASTSNWIPLTDISKLDRQSMMHVACKMTGADPWGGKGQMEGIFSDVIIQSTVGATPKTNKWIIGAELKATAQASLAAGSMLAGVYAKVTANATVTLPLAVGVYSLLDSSNTPTIASGYNFYADISSGSSSHYTARAILGCTAGTWSYGVDLNGGTFTLGSIRLSNGMVIKCSDTTHVVFSLGAYAATITLA